MKSRIKSTSKPVQMLFSFFNDSEPAQTESNIIPFPSQKREKEIEKEMMEICIREAQALDW